jgi:hypothetical protein
MVEICLQQGKSSLYVFSLLLIAPGCLHTHLRNNTIAQMETVHDLQQQQVLDNLAMFVHDVHSYPYFSLIAGGTSQLTDTSSLAITNSWSRVSGAFLYSALGLNPSVSCAAQGVWQITPINDSVKLTVMRCLYQRAVAGCCHIPLPSDCPDCEKVFHTYYPWEDQHSMAHETQSTTTEPTPAGKSETHEAPAARFAPTAALTKLPIRPPGATPRAPKRQPRQGWRR